jgi:hypothetical protein
MSSSFLPAVLAAAGIIGFALPAGAYCRTSTTSSPTHDGHVCTPAQTDDSGDVIFWPRPRVTYSLQQDASVQIPFDAFQHTVRQAFDTWMAVDCGGGPPRIEVIEGAPAACALHEFNLAGSGHGNANIIFFREQAWDDDPSKFAVTTVTFGTEDGAIYDADMALNSALWHFTTGDAPVDVDLLSVVTHETGHFLGLAHSPNGDATMFRAYDPGQTGLRDLTADDRAGICAIYPPGAIGADCDPTPRHGFSPLCAADQTGPAPAEPTGDDCCCADGGTCVDGACVASAPADSGCATPRAPIGDPAVPAAGLALGLAALGRRRRARRAARGAQGAGGDLRYRPGRP